MKRFLDCDIFAVLGEFLRLNTEHYHSDFEYDKEKIIEAFEISSVNDRTLLWLSRRNGTHCFFEREVYVKGCHQNYTWLKVCGDTHENIAAFAVEPKFIRGNTPYGNLYEIDRYSTNKHIEKNALDPHSVYLKFASGEKGLIDYTEHYIIPEKGSVEELIILPKDTFKWTELLSEVRENRHEETYIDWTYIPQIGLINVRQKESDVIDSSYANGESSTGME